MLKPCNSDQTVMHITIVCYLQRVAGNRLFHIVVDDDVVASQCIELLRKGNLGRLTFLPLNRLRANVADSSRIDKFHADHGYKDKVLFPIVSKLKFDERIRPAVESIWGKVMLAKDPTIGSRAAKECGIECVTLRGDKVRVRLCTTWLIGS
jgi:structural maintenance of chromosome 3 (chondroitin sulfate proteoglycan 6)